MSLLCVCVHFMHCNSCMFVCLFICPFLSFFTISFIKILFNHCVKNCMFVC